MNFAVISLKAYCLKTHIKFEPLLETSQKTKVVQDLLEFSCPSPSLIVTNEQPLMRHKTDT